MSFPLQPPVQTPMTDKSGNVTLAWSQYFTRLSAKLNSTELNLSVTPNLIWTDANGNPHTLAVQT